MDRDPARRYPTAAAARRAAIAFDLLGIVLMHLQRQTEAEAIFWEEIDLESKADPPLQNRRALPRLDRDVSRSRALRRSADDQPQVARDRAALPAARSAGSSDVRGSVCLGLRNNNDAAHAEPLLRDVLARDIRVSGLEHKDTGLHESMLAESLIELHRDVEATALAGKAAYTLEVVLGPDNAYALSAWQTYGTATCNENTATTGLAVLRRVERPGAVCISQKDHRVHMAAAATGRPDEAAGSAAKLEP